MRTKVCILALSMLMLAGALCAQTPAYLASCGKVDRSITTGLYYFSRLDFGGVYCLADTTGLGAALEQGQFVYVWGYYIPNQFVMDCGLVMTANHIGTCDCCRGFRGNVDGDPSDGFDIADVAALIDYLYISFTPPACLVEADLDASGNVDIGDIAQVLDCLYIHPGDCSPALCRPM